MKIIIAGLGYVGASTAVLLAEKNQVQVVDPNSEKTQAVLYAINKGFKPKQRKIAV